VSPFSQAFRLILFGQKQVVAERSASVINPQLVTCVRSIAAQEPESVLNAVVVFVLSSVDKSPQSQATCGQGNHADPDQPSGARLKRPALQEFGPSSKTRLFLSCSITKLRSYVSLVAPSTHLTRGVREPKPAMVDARASRLLRRLLRFHGSWQFEAGTSRLLTAPNPEPRLIYFAEVEFLEDGLE